MQTKELEKLTKKQLIEIIKKEAERDTETENQKVRVKAYETGYRNGVNAIKDIMTVRQNNIFIEKRNTTNQNRYMELCGKETELTNLKIEIERRLI